MPFTVLQRPKLFTMIRALPDKMTVGVAVKGPAAKYALVWEWGTVRLHKPGPKTQWGANPDSGQTRIFTRTAPSGYVRIHKQQFLQMAINAFSSIDFQIELTNGALAARLQENMNRVMVEAAQLMANDAPIDTGLLRASMVAVSSGEVEQLLRAAYRPLLIGDFDA